MCKSRLFFHLSSLHLTAGMFLLNIFSSKYGIYQPNCGLDNITMSWGHDGMDLFFLARRFVDNDFRLVKGDINDQVFYLFLI